MRGTRAVKESESADARRDRAVQVRREPKAKPWRRVVAG